jgi:VanZ family protein
MKRKTVKNIRNIALWAAVVLWMILIYVFSSQVAIDSYESSARVTDLIIRIIEKVTLETDFDTRYLRIIRETAHFFVYFILGILVLSSLRGKLSLSKRLVATMLICTAFAVTDEFHQMFVPGRHPEVFDIFIDGLGSFFGILVKLVLEASIFKKFSNN